TPLTSYAERTLSLWTVYCRGTRRSRFGRSVVMSRYETLLWDEPEPGVVLITLNRPPMNPVTIAMLDEIRAAMAEVAADPKTRAVIFTGAGDKAFSAGADMARLEGEFAKAARLPPMSCRFATQAGLPGVDVM